VVLARNDKVNSGIKGIAGNCNKQVTAFCIVATVINSVKLLFFVMEKNCVHSAVGTRFYYVI